MAINRAPFNALVDDNGSGLTGSIWNKAAIAGVVLDPVDALTAYLPVAWTPTDASGAGLTITNNGSYYTRIGRVVMIQSFLIYPATASGATALIGGLPVTSLMASGLYVVYGLHKIVHISGGGANMQFFNPSTGGSLTNADMSGLSLVVAGTYLASS